MTDQTKRVDAGGTFDNRQPIADGDKLIAWFEAQGEKVVRVPVLLSQGQVGYGNANAKLGALTVRLDDSRLGMGIAMKARACAGKPRCAMWLDGIWRGKDDAGDYTFEVSRIASVIADDEIDAATYAQVEVPGPNAN